MESAIRTRVTCDDFAKKIHEIINNFSFRSPNTVLLLAGIEPVVADRNCLDSPLRPTIAPKSLTESGALTT